MSIHERISTTNGTNLSTFSPKISEAAKTKSSVRCTRCSNKHQRCAAVNTIGTFTICEPCVNANTQDSCDIAEKVDKYNEKMINRECKKKRRRRRDMVPPNNGEIPSVSPYQINDTTFGPSVCTDNYTSTISSNLRLGFLPLPELDVDRYEQDRHEYPPLISQSSNSMTRPALSISTNLPTPTRPLVNLDYFSPSDYVRNDNPENALAGSAHESDKQTEKQHFESQKQCPTDQTQDTVDDSSLKADTSMGTPAEPMSASSTLRDDTDWKEMVNWDESAH